MLLVAPFSRSSLKALIRVMSDIVLVTTLGLTILPISLSNEQMKITVASFQPAPWQCAAAGGGGSELHNFIPLTARGFCRKSDTFSIISVQCL